MAVKIILRHDTVANWESFNPVLALGEVGIETDTLSMKVGNGTSTWADLAYTSASPATVQSMIDTAVSGVLDFAPSDLDTLKELSSAINNDPNFFNTLATNLSNHAATTVNVHGIANTADLADKNYVDGAVFDLDVALDTHVNATTAHGVIGSVVGTSDIQVLTNKTMGDDLLMDGNQLSGLGAPTQADHAATKAYVDTLSESLNIHDAAKVATTEDIVLSTALLAGELIDGITLTATDRVLVKNQTTTSENGIYVIQISGAATRASDYNSVPEVESGDFIFVTLGDTNASTGWVQTATITTIGLDPILFTQFSGAGTYLAGNGLVLDNSTFSADTTVLATKTYASSTASTAEQTAIDHANELMLNHNVSTEVHGVADMTDLINSSQLANAIDTHSTDTTSVHGIADTSILATTIDPTFTGNVTLPSTTTIGSVSALEIEVLHGIIASTAEINKLDGLTASTVNLNVLDGITASTVELNILDGITASTAELNILDGVTATYTELNVLDGITASTTELNLLDGTLITTSELNYVSGVTNPIQDQIDSKAPIANPTFTGTVAGITKAMVGLGNVNNTTDANKPVSTATQNELDTKATLTDLSNHESDTTNIHGIADTSVLETQAGAQDKADAAETAAKSYTDTHELDTTNIHGIADTAELATKTFAQDKADAAELSAAGYTDTVVAALTTTDIEEGTNLYFTNERAQDAVGNNLGTGLSYNDTAAEISVNAGTGLQINSGSGAVEVDSTITTNTGTQTLTNKTLDEAILSGDTVVTSTTESTSTTSGALVVDGGLGIAGNLNAGGVSYFGDPTDLALTNPIAFYTKDVDDYIQIGIQNPNAGASASSDVVLTADNGTNSSYYVDLGIASSGYDYPDFNMIQPNDAYLIVDGGDLILNAATGGKAIDFYIGGSTETDEVGSWNEIGLTVANQLQVTGSTTLSSTLDVTGTVTANDVDVVSHVNYSPIPGASAPTWTEGNVYYDSEEKTLILQGAGTGNFEISVGQREWVRTRNSSGATIPKGTPVYVTGVHIPGDPTHGHHPTIAPAIASDKTKRDVIGITGESIANGSHGYTVVRGYIEGLDTSNLTSGARVHLSAETAGGLVTVAPGYPDYPVELGTCLTSSATVGTIYVNIASQSVEAFRVDNNAYVDGNLTVAGDFTIIGSQSSVSVANLNVDNNFIYLNSGDSIGSANTVFSGTGVNDGVFHGHYDGLTTKTFKVKIVVNGSGSNPDSFRWSTDDFVTDNGSDIQLSDGLSYDLSDGISISFVSDNGHIVNDTWTGTAAPIAVDIALIGNRNTGTTGPGYTHLGMFYDVTDDKFKFFSEYAPEPEGNIDTGDTSFTYGVVKASAFEGDLTGNVTGSVSGNAGTVTNGVYTTSTGVVTNTMLAGSITDSKLSTISTAGKVANSATTAASVNTANAIVARDSSGNFTAGVITAALSGNADTATNATNATNAVKAGITEDTTTNGSKYLTWVDANTGNNPVKTTSTKLTFNPSTGVISATGFAGVLTGNASTVTNGVYTTDTGTVTSAMIANGTIVDADISSSAAIATSKLAANTISGVALGSNLNALTIGTGLSGSSYNGSSAVTVAIDSSVVTTLTGTQTLTNKTLTSPSISTPTISSGLLTVSSSGIAFSDSTVQFTAGVPSLTTIKSAIAANTTTSSLTSALTYRDALVPISGVYSVTVDVDGTNGVTFPIGTSINFYQTSGTGGASLVQGAGVTLQATPGLVLRALYSSATITKVAANTWLVYGDLKA